MKEQGRDATHSGVTGEHPRHLSLRQDGIGTNQLILSVSGHINREAYTAFNAEWQLLLPEVVTAQPKRISIDLTDAISVDSVGALLLMQLQQDLHNRRIQCLFTHVQSDTEGIFNLIRQQSPFPDDRTGQVTEKPLLVKVGDASIHAAREFIALMTFFGEMIVALLHVFRHPRTVRWNDVLVYIQRAGVEGLPIVGLISFLLGLILAFMSSLQLKPLGAGTYVAALVGISVVKELGPIMTAIVVAGRSGSAFAAEIGTMKVNEEVDALVVMGFDPMKFIALPKILAAILVLPLLTLYADLFAIIGGLLVGVVGLDLTAHMYMRQTLQGIHMSDISTSLLKSAVFAVLIAGISCQRGFQVAGAAEAVGRQTTSAVVSALFLVIIADSIFAVALHYIK